MHLRYLLRLGLWASIGAWLSGCGAGDSVNNDDEPQIEAIAVVIGQPFDNGAAGVQTRVRSGAEVLLSGKESRKGEDDTGVPIIGYEWTQTGGAPVQLIERSSHTIAFTAPRVRESSTLNFRLTVSDAKGQSDTTEVAVAIDPVPDPDRFLEFLEAADEFEVVAATSAPIAPAPASTATDATDFTITVTRLVSFTDRDGIQHDRVAVGEPVVRTGEWLRRLGSSSDCAAMENPRLRFQIPRLDLDDAIAGTNQLLSDRMEVADVDTASVYARIEISAAGAVQAGVEPVVCVNALPAASAGMPEGTSVEHAIETLTAATGRRDDYNSALAYYDTIDPATGAQKKDTLRKWLVANGFDPQAVDWAADVHSVYVNNFDLGFGRDMYMKRGACDRGAESLPLSQRAGRCDLSFVVMNYPSLESAARKLGALLAVAMEYSAASPGGERFAKFYIFAPDRRTGEFERVLSSNLDGRGEKFVPQGCVTCHGGVSGRIEADGRYTNGGDIGATFLPWDMDALLFSDDDASFTTRTRYSGLRAAYTRSSQEAAIKTLNAGAYLTFSDPANAPGRFALARELVEGWYGGVDLPGARFDSQFTPPGWQPAGLDGVSGTADDNPASAAALYHDVFGPHCRACHVAHAPAPGVPNLLHGEGDPRVPALCNDDPADDAGMSVAAPDQLPIACYQQLVRNPVLGDVLSGGRMPLARLTFDRLWTRTGSASAGEALTTHLRTRNVAVAAPGTSLPCIDEFGSPSGPADARRSEVERGNTVRLSAACSRTPAASWTLEAPAGSRAVLVGATTATPAFRPDLQGEYVVTLRDEFGASVTRSAYVSVQAPTPGSDNRVIVLPASGVATLDVDVTTVPGFSSRDALASIDVVSQSGLTATAIDATRLRLVASSVAGGSVSYRLTDTDGDQSATVGTITLTVSASIAANDGVVEVPANSTSYLTTLDLHTLVSRPEGQPYTLTVVQQPALDRGRGTGVVAIGPDGRVTVTAPPGVMSHFAATQVGSTDRFEYRACFTAGSACDTGNITIRIVGQRSFESVRQEILQTCQSGCHQAPQVGAALVMNDSITARQLYCNIRSGASITGNTGTEPTGTPYVNIAQPADSLINRKPRGEFNHYGGFYPDQAAVIFDWLNEGAYFTEGNDQACN